MENIIIGLIGGSFGAGLLAIIQAYLQHRWKQKDTHDDGIKAIIAGQKNKLIKDEAVKALFDLYGVYYEE